MTRLWRGTESRRVEDECMDECMDCLMSEILQQVGTVKWTAAVCNAVLVGRFTCRPDARIYIPEASRAV